ncbi:MAG: hypothetical protein M5U28_32920 [Sandaracinaceae bacterium]|nr:hypothetical protein [Sandaracinaceae bacterium]
MLFEGGAAEDPADAHGLTAVLAQVAADGCERIAQRELGATLASLGAEVTPVLAADTWGLRVEGPSERWRDLVHLAPRCAAVPDLDPWLVEHGRATALARAAEPQREALALTATLLSPSSPGRVAPDGKRARYRRRPACRSSCARGPPASGEPARRSPSPARRPWIARPG